MNGKKGRSRKRIKGRALALLFALCLLLFACEMAQAPSTPNRPPTAATAPGPGSETAQATRPLVVTVTPDPALLLEAPASYAYTEVHDHGPQLLDPILAWDAGSRTVIRNVMETLVYPHPIEGDGYVPLLATGWRISNNGRTYTFSIRRGVRFSNGNELTATDVSYSLQRLLLASPPGGPQTLLLEPLLGITTTHGLAQTIALSATATPNAAPQPTAASGDAAAPEPAPAVDILALVGAERYTGDRTALLANVPANTLLALCRDLQATIVAEDGDNALTIQLRQPWAPLLSALSQTWTAVVDREWAIEQGAWDGSCETWQNWYALDASQSALSNTILGTGPYILDFWSPNSAYVLHANAGYWHGDNPMWNGGPSGYPALDTIQVRQSADANERRQLLESGEVDTAQLSRSASLPADRQIALICDWLTDSCEETASPSAPLRRIDAIPLNRRQALFFNFDIASGDSSFIGNGRLHAGGVPPDFFTDPHVRRAFAYCLDRRTFIMAGLGGDGLAVEGLLPPYISNFPQQADPFPHLLRLCNDELAQAWDGRLAQEGFHLQLPYEAGNAAQQALAVSLQESLRAINPAYRLEPVALPTPLYQQALNRRQAPLALFSWTPVLPDAYYWVAPAFQAQMAAFQQLPPDLQSHAHSLLLRLSSGNILTRAPVYADLNQFYAQEAPFIMLPQPAITLYQRRQLTRWLYNPADPLPYFYAFR